MLSINTNLQSLIVQNNLTKSTTGLNQAIERMTTGYKINHASDNAAGYSIAQNMTSKLNSYEVARDNTSMGMDLISTAADSLDLISTHLQRIRDLAEQAANGTYGAQSLQAIQSEVDARISEINRVVANTEYNGINLFECSDPSVVTASFINEVNRLSEDEAIAQGYTIIKTKEDMENINGSSDTKFILMNDIDLGEWTPFDFQNKEFNGNGYSLKNMTITSAVDLDGADCAGLFIFADGSTIRNLDLSNINIDVTQAGDQMIIGGICAYALAIDNCSVSGNCVSSSSTYTFIGGIAGGAETISNSHSNININFQNNGEGTALIGGIAGFNSAVSNCYSEGSIYSNGSDDAISGIIGSVFFSEISIENSYSKVALSGPTEAKAGLTAAGYEDDISNSYFDIGICGTDAAVIDGELPYQAGLTSSELNSKIAAGLLPQARGGSGPNERTLQVGVNGDSNSQITVDTGFSIGLSINVLSNSSAVSALATIDDYINQVSEKQTHLGAAYNRLESALDSIGVSIDNLTSSRSTLRDADIAKESSQYIKNQILQQAAATLLATANQTPSIALQLL